jgi:hypothetical protein
MARWEGRLGRRGMRGRASAAGTGHATSASSRARRVWRRKAAVVSSVVAFTAGLAGIVGTGLAVVDRPPEPPPRTLAMWVTEADAACDTTQPQARELLRRAFDALAALNATGTYSAVEIESAARAVEDAADSQRLVLGHWRALAPPASSVDARRVTDLVASGDRAVDDLYAVGTGLRSVDLANPQASVGALVEATQHVAAYTSHWQAFRTKAADAGIRRCGL